MTSLQEPPHDVIEYRDARYFRYPNSPRKHLRRYYSNRQAVRLGYEAFYHRQVYIDAHGPIPKGHVVHHIDGDTLNNNPANLAAMTPGEHLRAHNVSQRSSTPEHLAHLAAIRPMTTDWHGSPEGLAWHSEHGKRSWDNREPTRAICENCGAEYRTFTPDRSRSCSNACWRALRPTVTGTCAGCGAAFEYVPGKNAARYCSRSCASKYRRRPTQRDADYAGTEAACATNSQRSKPSSSSSTPSIETPPKQRTGQATRTPTTDGNS